MTTHHLEPDRVTVHGCFSREFEPILTVEAGDRVVYRLPDVSRGLEPHPPDGGPRRKIEPRLPRDDGPAMVGPVFVRGAEPGRVLEVEFEEIVPGSWGWSWTGPGPFMDRWRSAVGVEGEALVRWDLEAGLATSDLGVRAEVRPFLGCVGVAPASPGVHPGWPPRDTGGNLDCRELVAGSRLMLPVAVPGALLSLGDGHALQGNGEGGGTAVECPMDRVSVVVRVRQDLALRGPRAETPAGTVCFGFGPDLDTAAAAALGEALDVLQERLEVTRARAFALSGALVDLRITQIVNGVVGVHAVVAADFNG